MNLEITTQTQGTLPRKDLRATLTYTGETPKKRIVAETLTKKLGGEENVVVRHIYTKYGTNIADVHARVYEDEETMLKLENEDLLNKHKEPEGDEE